MAIQVLAGIPWLAGVIGALFSGLFTWAAQFFTRRLAIVVAAVAVLVTVTTAFMAGIHTLASSLSLVLPPEFSQAAGLIVPSNAAACATAYITARFLRWAYEWNVRIIQYKLF